MSDSIHRESRSPRSGSSEAEGLAQQRSNALEAIHREFLRLSDAGVTKYMQLYKAVLAGVSSQALRPGDQIPPEDVLTANLGMSLGTVRRALAHLAAGGVVSREHGRGTFIASHSRVMEDSWHFRFLTKDQSDLLPSYSHVLDRRIVKEEGPWSDALGGGQGGYVLIQRSFNINDEFLCYSEFFLKAQRFKRFLKLPIDRLESVNLKKVLNEEFGAPTIYVKQHLRVERIEDGIRDLIALSRRSFGLCLLITAFTYDNVPLSYHRIYVPPTEYLLDLSRQAVAPGAKGMVD